MLNVIWPILIGISIIYAILNGNIEQLNDAIFSIGNNTIELVMVLLGTICFWNGIINIVKNTSLIDKINQLLSPIMNLLFPKIKKGTEKYNAISMNIISNLLGLGNAATPMGLKAMEIMQKENKNKNELSDEMALLIVLNTASIQIIPTTIIGIRNSLNSTNPSGILIPVWLSTIVAAMSGILMAKILSKRIKGKK